MGKVFKDKPINEIILRKFERPVGETKDELVRKFCISLGLLQPGDSRDVIVDIFKVLIDSKKQKLILTSKEVEAHVKNVRSGGVASSNIRRQLLRLERLDVVEKKGGGYRIKEFQDMVDILDDIKRFLIEPTFERIKDYAQKIDKL